MRWTDRVVKNDTVQVSKHLRRGKQGYFHYCPGCEEMHILPDSWSFDGNLESPTFSPSFRHSGVGEHEGNKEKVCHYILTAGVLNFCGDCWHSLSGKSVPLPVLPEGYTD